MQPSKRSQSAQWSLEDLDFRLLSDLPPPGFDCGREDQNEYLHEHAQHDQQSGVSVTYILYVKEVPTGYITLTMDAIRLSQKERPDDCRYMRLPAVKAAQLGIDKGFQKQNLGQQLVSFAVIKAQELSRQVGCRYVTLDAKSDLVGWYEKQDFVKNKLEEKIQKKERPDATDLPVSMRFDIQTLED